MFIDLEQYVWIGWLIVIVVLLIVELLTFEFTSLMLAVGSVGGLATYMAGGDWWLQIIVAGLLAVALLFTIRPLLLRTLHKGRDERPTNVDALLGLQGRVLGGLGPLGGQVKLANGETWTARFAPEVPKLTLADGDRVSVATIDGSTAVVVPIERNTP